MMEVEVHVMAWQGSDRVDRKFPHKIMWHRKKNE